MKSGSSQVCFTELVREHHVPLRAFIRSLGVRPEWVDDLAQEAFLVAYQELSSFDADRDFGKWLRGIARNLVRNEVRKHARRQRILHGELTEHLLSMRDAEGEPSRYEGRRTWWRCGTAWSSCPERAAR